MNSNRNETEMVTEKPTTAREIAKALGVGPRTTRYVLCDEFGYAYDGSRYEHVLSALARSDRTDLPARVHTVAYALYKSLSTGRMQPTSANRIAVYSPYQLCAVVARIAKECPETTIGGICDGWIGANHTSL